MSGVDSPMMPTVFQCVRCGAHVSTLDGVIPPCDCGCVVMVSLSHAPWTLSHTDKSLLKMLHIRQD